MLQYNERSTTVLLIVSLAGIKVCSPDGKVSKFCTSDSLALQKPSPSSLCATSKKLYVGNGLETRWRANNKKRD